jgi:hypothetical protein
MSMTREQVLARLERWADSPDDPRYCDALCDAAEWLGLPNGEYQYEDLYSQVEQAE